MFWCLAGPGVGWPPSGRDRNVEERRGAPSARTRITRSSANAAPRLRCRAPGAHPARPPAPESPALPRRSTAAVCAESGPTLARAATVSATTATPRGPASHQRQVVTHEKGTVGPGQWAESRPERGQHPGRASSGPAADKVSSNACADSHCGRVAVLYCCTRNPAVRKMPLTCEDKGT